MVRRIYAVVLTLVLGSSAAYSSSHALSSGAAVQACTAGAGRNTGSGAYFGFSVVDVATVRETGGSKVPGLAKFLQPLSSSSQIVDCQTLPFGGGQGSCKGGASRFLVTPDHKHTFTYPCAFINDTGLPVPTT
jgi:hypothetical protein